MPTSKRTRSGRSKRTSRTRYRRTGYRRRYVRGKYVGRRSLAKKEGRATISGSEYIGDIQAADLFTLYTVQVNPGLAETFPWLARIAQCYQEYDFRYLRFRFKSMSADALLSASSSTGLGTVVMGMQYNTSEPLFETKQQMENYLGSKSAKPSANQMFSARVRNSQSVLGKQFIRTGNLPPGQDSKFYDVGVFSIAVQGCQIPPAPAEPGVIGELWVDYSVTFTKPSVAASVILTDSSRFTGFTVSTHIFGATRTQNPEYNFIGMTFPSNNSFVLPANPCAGKKFLVTINVSAGAAGAVTWPTNPTITGGVLVTGGHQFWAAVTPTTIVPQSGSSAAFWQYTFIVECLPTTAFPNTTVNITPSASTLPFASMASNIFVTEVNDSDDLV